MYMLNMVIILIVMYCNVVTAIDKIPTYLLRFNTSYAHSRLNVLVAASWFKPNRTFPSNITMTHLA